MFLVKQWKCGLNFRSNRFRNSYQCVSTLQTSLKRKCIIMTPRQRNCLRITKYAEIVHRHDVLVFSPEERDIVCHVVNQFIIFVQNRDITGYDISPFSKISRYFTKKRVPSNITLCNIFQLICQINNVMANTTHSAITCQSFINKNFHRSQSTNFWTKTNFRSSLLYPKKYDTSIHTTIEGGSRYQNEISLKFQRMIKKRPAITKGMPL